MPLSSSRRCIHHGDTAVGSMPVTGPQPEPQHAGAGLDRHRQRLALGGQRRDVGRVDEVEVVGAGDLAGHAAHRQAVAAVRGDREVEHDVVEAEHVGGVVARLGGARRQHQDAGVVGAEVQFGRRADHAVGGAAVGLAGGDGEVAGQRGAGQRHHDQVADGEVGCTADDVARLALRRRRPCTARIGFLNSVSSSISTTRPTVSGPVTGPTGMISSTSWPMRISVCSSSSARHVPAGCAGLRRPRAASCTEARIRPPPRTAARTARRPRPCRACRECRCGTAGCAPGPCRTRSRSRPRGRCRRRATHSG